MGVSMLCPTLIMYAHSAVAGEGYRVCPDVSQSEGTTGDGSYGHWVGLS